MYIRHRGFLLAPLVPTQVILCPTPHTCGITPWSQISKRRMTPSVCCRRNCAICFPNPILKKWKSLRFTHCLVTVSSLTRIGKPSRAMLRSPVVPKLYPSSSPISASATYQVYTCAVPKQRDRMWEQETIAKLLELDAQLEPERADIAAVLIMPSVSDWPVPTVRCPSNGTRSG